MWRTRLALPVGAPRARRITTSPSLPYPRYPLEASHPRLAGRDEQGTRFVKLCNGCLPGLVMFGVPEAVAFLGAPPPLPKSQPALPPSRLLRQGQKRARPSEEDRRSEPQPRGSSSSSSGLRPEDRPAPSSSAGRPERSGERPAPPSPGAQPQAREQPEEQGRESPTPTTPRAQEPAELEMPSPPSSP